MKTTATFQVSDVHVHQLMAEYPFAQLVSSGADILQITPLPLLLQHDEQGRAFLLGHFARANPHVQALAIANRHCAIFMGPHAYQSPSWLRDRTQAPTWLYATVHCQLRIALDEQPGAALHAVEALTAHMEQGRTNAWAVPELGARLPRMLPAIVAFRAEILNMDVKFKLGQNETGDVWADVQQGLALEGRTELLHWANAVSASKIDLD